MWFRKIHGGSFIKQKIVKMAHQLQTDEGTVNFVTLQQWLAQNSLLSVSDVLIQENVSLEKLFDLSDYPLKELKKYAKESLQLDLLQANRFAKAIKRLSPFRKNITNINIEQLKDENQDSRQQIDQLKTQLNEQSLLVNDLMRQICSECCDIQTAKNLENTENVETKSKDPCCAFSGVWSLRAWENLDEYLKSEGWGIFMRKATYHLMWEYHEIEHVNEKITIQIKQTKGTHKITAIMNGSETTYIDCDGREVLTRMIFKRNRPSIVETRTVKNKWGTRTYKITTYLENNEMKRKIENEAGKYCVRIYSKLKQKKIPSFLSVDGVM
eukprot:389678_1